VPAQAKKLKDAVFLWGQVHRLVVDRDDAGIEIDGQLAGADRRFRVAFGTEKSDLFVKLTASRED
jgi:hypothetical protein